MYYFFGVGINLLLYRRQDCLIDITRLIPIGCGVQISVVVLFRWPFEFGLLLLLRSNAIVSQKRNRRWSAGGSYSRALCSVS